MTKNKTALTNLLMIPPMKFSLKVEKELPKNLEVDVHLKKKK